MRNPKRIDAVLVVLKAAWEANPDLRLGQLIVNSNGGKDPFYIEDDVLMENMAKATANTLETLQQVRKGKK